MNNGVSDTKVKSISGFLNGNVLSLPTVDDTSLHLKPSLFDDNRFVEIANG